MSKKYAIASFATQRYSKVLPNLARRISACIYKAKLNKGVFVLVTDKSKLMQEQVNILREYMPEGWDVEHHPLNVQNDRNLANYKLDAQLLIAQLQSHAFAVCRKKNVDYLWSVESDVIPSVNSLSSSLDMLEFDDGYYDVVMSTYPSQGGGSFLGGHGTYKRPIEQDFKPEERDAPKALLKKAETLQKKIDKNIALKEQNEETYKERLGLDKEYYEVVKEIEKHPPKDSIFSLISEHGWRRRGWLEYAYPAVGKGAVLPTDWVGFGCTLMSRKALALADFEGYDGRGTQDLHVCWKCWKPAGINMCVNVHAPSDHVIRKRSDEAGTQDFGDLVHIRAFHEPEGEYKDHLRQQPLPLFNHSPGENMEAVIKNSPSMASHYQDEDNPRDEKEDNDID